MGILFYVVVNIISLSYFITTVSSVEICNNQTHSERSVNLSKIYESGGSCGCSVKLADSDKNSNIIINSTDIPHGCQYKLMFRLKNKTREYSCSNYFNFITFLMTPTDHLYVYLMNDRNVTSDFIFNFNIQFDTRINLSCRSPWTHPNLLVTTQSTTTVDENSFHSESTPGLDGSTGTIEIQTESTGTTERQTEYTGTTEIQTESTGTTERLVKSTGTTERQDESTGDTEGQTESTETTEGQTESTGTTEGQTESTRTTEGQTESTRTTEGQAKSTVTTVGSNKVEKLDNMDLPVIVGSSFGGVVLIIIVIIVICLVKRRQQKHQTNQSQYCQSNTDGNIFTDGYDTVPNDFNQPEHKNTVEVVIIPTYVPDSLDSDLENSTNGEHVPEQHEYAPGQHEQTQKQHARVPYTNEDYAVVKKPKKGPSQNNEMELNNNPNKTIVYDDYENIPKDKLNLTREINRIVGPKGDDYTLVNKC